MPRNAAGRENCKDDGKRCMTHELWANLNAHIFGYLRSVTLAELVPQQQKPDVTVLQDQRPQPATPRTPEPAEWPEGRSPCLLMEMLR